MGTSELVQSLGLQGDSAEPRAGSRQARCGDTCAAGLGSEVVRGDQPGTPNAPALGQGCESSSEPPTASTAQAEGAQQGQGRGVDGVGTAEASRPPPASSMAPAGRGRVRDTDGVRPAPSCPGRVPAAGGVAVTPRGRLSHSRPRSPPYRGAGQLRAPGTRSRRRQQAVTADPAPPQATAPSRMPQVARGQLQGCLPGGQSPQPWACHLGKIAVPTTTVAEPAGLTSAPYPPTSDTSHPAGEECVPVYVCDACPCARVRVCTRLC